MKQIDVSILGRDYSLVCSESEKDNLISAVSYVNDLASQIQEKSKSYTNERVAVMVALQIAGELMGTKISDKSSIIEGVSIGEIREKIDSISLRIESILKK
ncbi:cell division protein ZapA [Candidatus Kinetoplastibacterium desouzaii TCC079E]|uniref:Cell division protein ZapA n=1 Tax=Candidatus Kinetoplastidibacterium desouzai TCC079E TaxID=1208919 RepID=M1M4J4_9PROT|nr:cell division protein ZapA [Candidatus Kinetoplastibacterium desouzaii]AGF47130.1 cell division protein ZapA [Candidatus Kinetoplastibacterium desouzaii TCC079E]